jgi:hypothetical protein
MARKQEPAKSVPRHGQGTWQLPPAPDDEPVYHPACGQDHVPGTPCPNEP